MYPHRINLRGPWQCETLDTALPKRVHRVNMPCRWADTPLNDCSGRIRCQRRFHWQKPLDAKERLFLVVGAADYRAEVTLNGQFLGKHEGAFDPFEFEITHLVQASNDLSIEVDSQGGLWGTVFLEVRRECFLHHVNIHPLWVYDMAEVYINGLVVGPEEQQLDLDLLLNDSLLLSQHVKASVRGNPFQLLTRVPGIERWLPAGFGKPALHELRLELLDVHSRLFVEAKRIGFRENYSLESPTEFSINGHRCPWPPPWILNEPVLESPTLEQADAEGRLLNVIVPNRYGSGGETILRHLSWHPAVFDMDEA